MGNVKPRKEDSLVNVQSPPPPILGTTVTRRPLHDHMFTTARPIAEDWLVCTIQS
jgi:hypothetical protein